MDKNKHFGLTDSLIEAVKNCMSKEELVGGQKKLDVNKNGKLDAEDFKKLRGEGKMGKMDDEEEEDDEEEDEDEGVESSADEKKEKKKENAKMAEATLSAKAARAGKDIGKPGKMFDKIAAKAGEKYGSAERGKNVAGAILKKMRAAKEEVQVDEAFDTANPKSYNVTVHHKTKDGEVGKADYNITKATDTRHAKNIAMIRHQKTLASKGVKYSSMHSSSQDVKKLDEAFPTVADAKKRMADAEKVKLNKKVTPTGAVYTKKYKEDEKEKNEMYEGMDSSPVIGLAVAKHLAKMSAKKQTKKNNK